MYAIGLTGGIGSGKTTVANKFLQLGIHVIDTDIIAHQLTAAQGLAMPQILATFGSSYMQSNGALDRQRMRALVFKDQTAKQKLENILHPLIQKVSNAEALNATSPYIIFVVPLLVESVYWAKRVDRILVIDCSTETQIQRVIKRNAFSREQVLSIMAQQATREQRLAIAHDVVSNEVDTSDEELAMQTQQLHEQYLLWV